jgi:hypothetical protein
MTIGVSDSDLRSVALVVLGAAVGFFPLLLQQPIQVAVPAALALSLIMVVCLLYGVGVLQNQYHSHVLEKRAKQPFQIGILNDMGDFVSGADYYVWTDAGLDAWKKALESAAQELGVRVSVSFVKATESFDKFSAVMNPYGGAYPEVDLGKLTTLHTILNYVSEGGLFVNVADVPTYWAYSPLLGRRVDNTPSTEIPLVRGDKTVILPYRSFFRTPLVSELGLKAFNVEKTNIEQNLDSILDSPEPIAVRASRVVGVEYNVESCVPTLRLTIGDDSGDFSQIVYVKYGNGKFLLSLAWIRAPFQNEHTKARMPDAIAKLTLQALVHHQTIVGR